MSEPRALPTGYVVQFVYMLTSSTRSLPLPVLIRDRASPADMIDYSEKDGRLTFKVRVVPRASRSEIVGEHDGALRVRIAAPPVEGAANEELVRTLAQVFKVARGAIEIVAGHTSKLKTVRVAGLEPAALASLSTTHGAKR